MGFVIANGIVPEHSKEKSGPVISFFLGIGMFAGTVFASLVMLRFI
jgi:hypothetical protein